MRPTKISLLLALLCTTHLLPAQEESKYYYRNFGETQMYYEYTEYGMIPIEQLPRDTVYVHDTVFVSELDDFLKQYNCDLQQFVHKYSSMQTMIDSLNTVSGMRLYYNYFLPQDTASNISNRFIVKEFSISASDSLISGNPLHKEYVDFEQSDRSKSLVRREILFTVDDTLQTERFLRNKQLQLQSISSMFSYMQADSLGIEGINLYFPDINCKDKRKLTQFVKSVRIAMDASKQFKFKNTRLTVILHAGSTIDYNFQHCLMQEATEVLFIDKHDVINNFYVRGQRMTTETMDEVSFFAQLLCHFYIARYYTGTTDILQLNIERFTPEDMAFVLSVDYPENTWEMYLYMLIGIAVFILIVFLLYTVFVPFSGWVNKHINSILVILIILVFEMVVLVINIFQSMCKDDSFIFIDKHPQLRFIMPLFLVLLVPVLIGIFKKKNLP